MSLVLLFECSHTRRLNVVSSFTAVRQTSPETRALYPVHDRTLEYSNGTVLESAWLNEYNVGCLPRTKNDTMVVVANDDSKGTTDKLVQLVTASYSLLLISGASSLMLLHLHTCFTG